MRQLPNGVRGAWPARAETMGGSRPWRDLNVKNPVKRVRCFGLQDVDSYIMDRNSGSGLAAGRAVMGVAVYDEVGSVAIHYFNQAGGSKEW